MNKNFKRVIMWLLLLGIFIQTLPANALDESFDTRFYWLYSSAIPAGWKVLSDMETKPVTVAVIDTGIETDNEHLKDRIDLENGRNFVASSAITDFEDKEGHGTAIAGIIAGVPTEYTNYYGVCGNLDVKILPLKVYSDITGALRLQHIIDAIYYAISMNVDVINISIDIPHYDEDLQIACLAAYEKNIPIVSSAGNKGNEYYSYPSSNYGVISVSALSLYNNEYFLSSPFSSYNDRIDICAQGEDIFTLGINGTYTFASGSSFSCAIVAGAVAILKAINKDLTPLEIETILCYSADSLTDAGRNNYYGYGKLNLLSALNTDLNSLSFHSEIQVEERETPFSFEYIDYKNSISCGLSYGLWINENGTVSTAGDSSFGKTDVDEWENVVSVATGDSFSLGLNYDGKLLYTGFSDSYALNVNHWSSIKQISSGSFHTVAVTSTGSVLSTGSNSAGQCNTSIIAGVSKVECGSMHTALLRSNGTVRCVGTNYFGECNTSGWTDIVSIAAGNGFTLGLKKDGTVIAVGNNSFRQTQTSDWTEIIEIFAGYNYAIGLRSDGTLVYTGLATPLSQIIPTLTNIKTISCGRDMIIVKTNEDHLSILGNVQAQERTTNKIYVFNYDDISQDYWAAPYIHIVSRLGIINGVYNGTGYIYIPYVHMTRQEFIKVIIETMGIPTKNLDLDIEIFADYEDIAQWSLPYIKAAYIYGYLTGSVDSEGKIYLRPKDPISRAEAAAIMGRAFGIGQSSDIDYIDKDTIPYWAYNSIAYFTTIKVLSGYPDNSIRPNSELYRSEAAAIICRLYSYVLNGYTSNKVPEPSTEP